ncbi:MAG: fused MFS/spermidine synthase [Actinomycetia bacterium]|nr:fused MFS/spermidine synthase [Actinomycetes bacterium]
MNDRPNQPLFVATIGLSSFVLFTLELLAGRLVLPVFGGTPSVWTTALCFFTGVVFVGYAYAHLVATRLGQRAGGAVHLALAALVVAATLLVPADLSRLRFDGMPAALNVLAVLALVAGAPALLLATTTPLLSAWFSGRGRDPWWLYAVSNGASLAGLIAYPFVIEPFMPLSAQRTALVVLLAVLAVLLARVVVSAPRDARARRMAPTTSRPTLWRQAAWLFAAAIPAGLLSATTMQLATDQISTPLLWIGPLGIYLGSFVIAFSERGRRLLPVAEKLVPAAATVMWVPFVVHVSWPEPVLVTTLLAAFAVLSVTIHGRVALSRPDESRLTGFYLVVSAGGLIATAFVALVAPLVFSDVFEYPLLIIGGLAALAILPGPAWRLTTSPGAALRAAGRRLVPYLAVSGLLITSVSHDAPASALFVSVVLVIGALVIAVGRTPRALALSTTVAIVTLVLVFSPGYLVRVRTFFGITEVRSARDGTATSEIHGTTLHGLQFQDARRAEPTSYFVRSGPLGDVFANLAERVPQAADVGVVGLGIGTIAAYERPGDTMTYFEVDQAVIDLARDRRYFTYLADATAPPRIVLGDGRLSLADAPAGAFDVLVLDAFSSDAVPAHLLTREAMRTYARTLKPGGILVFQLTNRHFDLASAVAETARSIGLDARTKQFTPSSAESARLAAQPSRWLVAGSAADVAPFDELGWTQPGRGSVLTDDYTSILQLMRW